MTAFFLGVALGVIAGLGVRDVIGARWPEWVPYPSGGYERVYPAGTVISRDGVTLPGQSHREADAVGRPRGLPPALWPDLDGVIGAGHEQSDGGSHKSDEQSDGPVAHGGWAA
ncbi:MAG TPA: hypothetical protein VGW74_07015 [Propionibacteriaceae bacterium]|nr:hypothetical protein [Propionibacteriaceae bacterium]